MLRNRNYRRKDVSMKCFPRSMAFVVVVVVGIALTYWSYTVKCTQLGEKIRQGQEELARLQREYKIEAERWNANLTSSRLKAALTAHGLGQMEYAREDQIVRMDRSGKPIQNQRSIAKFMRNRQSVTTTARNKDGK